MGMKNERRGEREEWKGVSGVFPVSIHGIPCIRIIIDSTRRVEEIGRVGLRFPRSRFSTILNVPTFFSLLGI